MKRLLVLLMFIGMFMTGCSSKKVIWEHEPDLKVKGVRALVSSVNMQGVAYDLTGYPGGFFEQSRIPVTEVDLPGYITGPNASELFFPINEPERLSDDVVVLTLEDGNEVLFNYEGEQLIKEIFPADIMASGEKGASRVRLFTEDRTSQDRHNNYLVKRFNEDYTSYTLATELVGYDSGMYDPFVVKDGKIGTLPLFALGTYDAGGNMVFNKKFTETGVNKYNDNSAVYRVDEDNNYNGIAIIYDGKIIESDLMFTDRPWYDRTLMINGFVKVMDENEKCTFISKETGEAISECKYDELQFFEDGYAPVRIEDKWGFIDENGNEVTPFVFDDASVLYDGKTWVSYNGYYGVLNLKKTIEAGIEINEETLAYKVNERSVEGEMDNSPIGTATVKVEKLRMRESYSTKEKEIGVCEKGKTYNVYATRFRGDYFWFQIDDGAWIADKDGEWVTFTARQ